MSLDEHGTEGTEQSPPKPPAGRRAVLVVALLLLIAGATGVAIYSIKTQYLGGGKIAAGETGPPPNLPDDFGAEDAKLKIESCVGPCITFIAVGIAEGLEAWPDKVRAEFYSYGSPEGQKFVEEHGESLACTFINGKNRFVIEQNGQRKQVHLAGPPAGEWTMQDLAAIITQQWREIYGELPEGFEEGMARLAQMKEYEPESDAPSDVQQ